MSNVHGRNTVVEWQILETCKNSINANKLSTYRCLGRLEMQRSALESTVLRRCNRLADRFGQ